MADARTSIPTWLVGLLAAGLGVGGHAGAQAVMHDPPIVVPQSTSEIRSAVADGEARARAYTDAALARLAEDRRREVAAGQAALGTQLARIEQQLDHLTEDVAGLRESLAEVRARGDQHPSPRRGTR